ncbi:hypothetical protein ACEPPN_015048 [Leptodophora sp. 'Broadleaf-Isolate-01']
MIPFDFIAQKNAQEAEHGFIRKIVEAKHEIMSFVNNRLGWNEAREFLNYFKGSFNLSIAVKNAQTDERALIRFPLLGKYMSRGEREKSRTSLRNEADPAVLDLDINEAKLDIIYEQIASFMLELSRLEFPRIGAISNVSGEWVVAEPPLTYDMNEVVGFTGFPADYFTTLSSFTCSSDYFAARAHCLQAHLETQRNIAFEDEDITWNRYIARYCFGKLIPARSTVYDSRPFRIFCDDLRPSNMLVDPKTMRITALLDFEFTDVMPAQFAYDLPWWLIL